MIPKLIYLRFITASPYTLTFNFNSTNKPFLFLHTNPRILYISLFTYLLYFHSFLFSFLASNASRNGRNPGENRRSRPSLEASGARRCKVKLNEGGPRVNINVIALQGGSFKPPSSGTCRSEHG